MGSMDHRILVGENRGRNDAMNRLWYLSFFSIIFLTVLCMIVDPETKVLIHWTDHSSFFGSRLLLFCSLLILIRNLRYLFSYLIEIPASIKNRYYFRFQWWLLIFLGWFLLLLYLFPVSTFFFAFLLITRETFIWTKKKKDTFTF